MVHNSIPPSIEASANPACGWGLLLPPTGQDSPAHRRSAPRRSSGGETSAVTRSTQLPDQAPVVGVALLLPSSCTHVGVLPLVLAQFVLRICVQGASTGGRRR